MKRMTVVLLALMPMAAPAQTYTISAKVGPLLKEAQALIAAKDYKAALAKMDEAEAVKSNPDDGTVINEFRKAIAISSLGAGQATCTTPGMVTRCDGRRGSTLDQIVSVPLWAPARPAMPKGPQSWSASEAWAES